MKTHRFIALFLIVPALFLILAPFVSALNEAPADLSGFGRYADVAQDAPHRTAIEFVTENRLMIGVSDGRFAPLETVTKAMAVTVLHRLAGCPEQTALFPDVGRDSWFSDAAAWAVEAGIAETAADGSYGPREPMTREQLAILFRRYSGKAEAQEAFVSDLMLSFTSGEYATRAELAEMIMILADETAAAVPPASPRKIIIDTDTGADDASALILAAKSNCVEILGVTTLVGNTDLEQSTRNALMALEIAGCGAPVYKGAASTFTGRKIDAFSVFGADGMGERDLIHPAGEAQEKDAVSFIIDTVRDNPGEVELVVLGPATNIALAMRQAPEVMKQVKMIWSMGTAGLGPGNASPVAEFNVYGDAEAYRAMLDFGVPVTVIGLDMCGGDAMWTSDQFRSLAEINEIGSFVSASFEKIREFYASNGSEDTTMNCDSLAMTCVLKPDFVRSSVRAHGSCITAEGETYAQVIFYREGFTYDVVKNDFDYNVTLVTEVAGEDYFANYAETIRD